MAALEANVPRAVGDRLAAFQEAISSQTTIARPAAVLASPANKRKRQEDDDPDASLDRDQHLNDLKLKSRFEHIFAKYGSDFTDTGDEVDILTGEITVDNGHLRHMTTQLDLGGRDHSRLAQMLDADLSKLEDHETNCDEDEADGDSWVEEGAESGLTDEDGPAERHDFEHQDDGFGNAFEDDDNETIPEDDLLTDWESGEADSVSSRKDVWNDAPLLPGDKGYNPFADVASHSGSSPNPLKAFEDDVSDPLRQLLAALETTQDLAMLNAQTTSGLKPQLTIDLDPDSKSYGKPVITYVPVGAPQRQTPAAPAAAGPLTQIRRENKIQNVDSILKGPRDVAINVLLRIADAGLPTVPGPDGKFPPYKSTKRAANGHTDGASANLNMCGEDAAMGGFSTDNASESQYSANTARPLQRKLLPATAPFTEEDDELILELRHSRGMGWDDIRDLCFQNRRIAALQYRYYTYLRSDRSAELTAEDDDLILELREEDGVSWHEIQDGHFPDFKISQLQYRYYTRLATHRNDDSWTHQQVAFVAELKDQRGLTWQQIRDDYFPHRNIGQIQYRYYKTGRPADWKEQIATMAEAFNQADEDGDDEAAPRTDSRKAKRVNKSSVLVNLQNRLAAADPKLTETKRAKQAEMRRKQDEREAKRRAAQEEKRRAKEAANIAKLKLIRTTQAAKSRSKLSGRDIALSPGTEPERPPSPYPLQPRPISHSAEQLFHAAAERCELREPEASRADAHALEGAEARQLAERQLLQQASQIGRKLLPKPPSSTPVLATPTSAAMKPRPTNNLTDVPRSTNSAFPNACQSILRERQSKSATMPPMGIFPTPRTITGNKATESSLQPRSITPITSNRLNTPKLGLFPSRDDARLAMIPRPAYGAARSMSSERVTDTLQHEDVVDREFVPEETEHIGTSDGNAPNCVQSATVTTSGPDLDNNIDDVSLDSNAEHNAASDQITVPRSFSLREQPPEDTMVPGSHKPPSSSHFTIDRPQKPASCPREVWANLQHARPAKTRKSLEVEVSDSEAPISIMTGDSGASARSDSDSSLDSGCEDDLFDSPTHGLTNVDYSMTGIDISDDELAGPGDDTKNWIWGLHSSFSSFNSAESRRGRPTRETPGKSSPTRRRGAPATTLRSLTTQYSSSPLVRARPEGDDNEDELDFIGSSQMGTDSLKEETPAARTFQDNAMDGSDDELA